MACSQDLPSCKRGIIGRMSAIYVRRCYRAKNGRRHAYWALVESYRTARGPRQRVVAYLGELDECGRMGVEQAVQPASPLQAHLFQEPRSPEWVDVDRHVMRVERSRQFGGCRLGLTLLRRLGLPQLLDALLPSGREGIRWSVMAQVLVLGRMVDASSELRLAEHTYEASALAELLGVPAEKVNEDRLYRTLDRILPHKTVLEKHPQQRLGELFQLDYDLLLYDVTSTYFEGGAAANPQTDARGGAHLEWSKREDWRDWARLSEGYYLLRSNVTDWSGEELWRAYVQLTEAEAAFRIHKSDLALRPVWHHLERRVQAHILVCFLTYVLWKTFGRWCQDAGLGRSSLNWGRSPWSTWSCPRAPASRSASAA